MKQMKLKKDADLIQFLKVVRTCSKDVLFVTEEGDTLNLKSALSQYIFSAISGQPDALENSGIQWQEDEDFEKLERFLEVEKG